MCRDVWDFDRLATVIWRHVCGVTLL